MSYTQADRPWAEWIAWELEAAGHRVTIQAWDFTPGSNFVVEMDAGIAGADVLVAVLSPDYLLSAFTRPEWAAAFSADPLGIKRKMVPVRVAPVDLSGLLQTTVYADLFGRDEESARREVLSAVAGSRLKPGAAPPYPGNRAPGSPRFPGSSVVAGGPQPPPERLDCPYKGLSAFGMGDAPFFFGRDREIRELVERVDALPVNLVVGPSGVGKSSLVHAGVLPRMATAGWVTARCTPRSAPLHSLVGAVLRSADQDERVDLRQLDHWIERMRDRGVVTSLTELAAAIDRRLLLFIDQFEELFTMSGGSADVDIVLDQLTVAAADVMDANVRIICTIRADFMHRLLSHGTSGPSLQGSLYLMSPMSVTQLHDVIVQPARKMGTDFAPGLVTRILADVGTRPGALPVLEFCLTQLWLRSQGNDLDHATYEALGTATGAIRQYADDVVEGLLRQGFSEQVVRRVFVALVSTDDASAPVARRAAHRSELGIDGWTVAQSLAAARLVVIDTIQDSSDFVQLSHEALISDWARLADWVALERSFIEWRARSEALVAAGITALVGPQLAEAKLWLEERPEEVPQPVKRMISLGLLYDDAQIRQAHWLAKGALQSVSSLVRLQGRRARSDDERRALDITIRRVRILALATEIVLQMARSPVLTNAGVSVVPGREVLRELAPLNVSLARDEATTDSGEGPTESPAVDCKVTCEEEFEIAVDHVVPFAVVLAELISNAVLHGYEHQSGTVRVTVRTLNDDDHQVRLEVEDDGEGFRIDDERTARSGLGLQLVEAIVTQQLEGTVTLRSAPGQGTRVTAVAQVLPKTPLDVRSVT